MNNAPFVDKAVLLVLVCYIVANTVRALLVRLAYSANNAGNTSLAIRRGETLLKIGFLLPFFPRIPLMYSVACWCLLDRQYSRSLDLIADLEERQISSALRVDMMRRKAECLEGLGSRDAADQQRRDAENVSLADKTPSRAALVARAALLQKTEGNAAAYPVYLQALAITPMDARGERDQLLGHLCTNSFLGGTSGETLKWATQLIEETADVKYSLIGYRMAAVACRTARDIDGAERYARGALNISRIAHRQHDIAVSLGYLASLIGHKGDPEGAIAAAEDAIAADPEHARDAWVTKAEWLFNTGRFTQGFEAAKEAQKCNNEPLPSSQRRFGAILQLLLARGHTLTSSGHFAIQALDAAVSEFKDEKMLLWCDSMYAHAYAIAGDRDSAQEFLARAMKGRLNLPEARDLQSTCLAYGARTSLELGDYESARGYIEEYVALEPTVTEMAFANYVRGRCAKGLNDAAEARHYFEIAASRHPSLNYSKLAAQELNSLVW